MKYISIKSGSTSPFLTGILISTLPYSTFFSQWLGHWGSEIRFGCELDLLASGPALVSHFNLWFSRRHWHCSRLIHYFLFWGFPAWFSKLHRIALISGFAPLLAKWLVVSNIPINNDLSNLSLQKVIFCVLVYALMSAGLHQWWFVLRDLESGSLNHFLVMFLGDIAGSILLIAVIKYGIDLVRRSKPKQD